MAFTLQLLRGLMEGHPERAGPLRRHVEALEGTVDEEPDRCVERVRALFEATYRTIGPQLGIVFADGDRLESCNKQIMEALDFALDGHPEAEKIDRAVRRLLGSINGTIGALAELSNIPGIRHGGSLDWTTLRRQHALMLGGLTDTLISFLFDIAWTRQSAETPEIDGLRYDDLETFNASLDDEYDEVEIAGSIFLPSQILYSLDPTQYEVVYAEWLADQGDGPAGEMPA